MIDIRYEPLLSLEDAAKLAPGLRAGQHVSTASVHRWARTGMRGVRLETIVAGGRRCTTREALQRFFSRVTEERDGRQETQPSTRRQKRPDAKTMLEIIHGIKY
jgi:hypothetical protein